MHRNYVCLGPLLSIYISVEAHCHGTILDCLWPAMQQCQWHVLHWITAIFPKLTSENNDRHKDGTFSPWAKRIMDPIWAWFPFVHNMPRFGILAKCAHKEYSELGKDGFMQANWDARMICQSASNLIIELSHFSSILCKLIHKKQTDVFWYCSRQSNTRRKSQRI